MIMKDSERTEYFDKIAIEISKKYRGKIQTISKVPITGLQDFSSLYTPGIAAVSKKIQAEKELVYDLTGSGKTAAYLLPVMNAIETMKGKNIKAIIVLPTRELSQIIIWSACLRGYMI